mmetsp:Transcript_54327/g.90143  ORF Transcript_54327/g.90143 Transcript_54327/m.90143 type:complete len:218 (-) Transcript_54327:57-710(-)
MAPKKKKGDKKKSDKKKKKGEVTVVGPQELKPAKTNFQHNEFIFSALELNAGATVVHVRGGQGDAAIGIQILNDGLQRLIYTIKKSSSNCGYGMVLGVTDAAAPLTDRSGGRAWGINPSTCRLSTTNNCYQRGSLGMQLMEGLNGLKHCCDGAVIEIEVEMAARRTLRFSVNGGPMVDACVQLPLAVRPWILMTWEEDTVSLDYPNQILTEQSLLTL